MRVEKVLKASHDTFIDGLITLTIYWAIEYSSPESSFLSGDNKCAEYLYVGGHSDSSINPGNTKLLVNVNIQLGQRVNLTTTFQPPDIFANISQTTRISMYTSVRHF